MPDPDPLDAGTPEDLPGPLYELQLGPNACDICDELSGVYPVAPDVPLHIQCQCTVVEAGHPDDAGGGGGGDCTTEIRDLEWETVQYTEEDTLTRDTCGQAETEIQLQLQEEPPDESFDEGVEEAALAAGWAKPVHTQADATITLAANARMEANIVKTYEDTMFLGQEWRICTEEDPVAGVHVTEEHIGPVGGFYGAVVLIEAQNPEFESCDDEPDGGDYFDSGDEFPDWAEVPA